MNELKGDKAYSREEAVRMDVQYRERYGSKAKSDKDARYGTELDQEQMWNRSEDQAWI